MSWEWGYFPKSKPRAAKGGIKAQTKRGQAFGKTWWAQRWIAVLEGFQLGARLTRGRSYARGGQVLSIDVAPGEVTASVQGSRPKPYAVSISVEQLGDDDWDQVVRVLSGQAVFAAKLLAGEMPQDIERAFRDAGVSLFPARHKDLRTDCSCPDDSNPCKHIAAVYYILGEEFDRDPFLLFRLRGLDRDALLSRLSASAAPAEVADEPQAARPPEPLPAESATFWIGGDAAASVFGEVATPRVSAAWLRRLGNFPMWRGEQPLVETLEPQYASAAARGLERFVGDVRR